MDNNNNNNNDHPLFTKEWLVHRLGLPGLEPVKALKAKVETQPKNWIDLRGVTLKGLRLIDAEIPCIDFSGATFLEGANFSNSKFWEIGGAEGPLTTRFPGAHLVEAQFSGTDLRFGDFRGAFLREAAFIEGRLSHTCFDGADLSGAKFSGATITAKQLAAASILENTVMDRELREAVEALRRVNEGNSKE